MQQAAPPAASMPEGPSNREADGVQGKEEEKEEERKNPETAAATDAGGASTTEAAAAVAADAPAAAAAASVHEPPPKRIIRTPAAAAPKRATRASTGAPIALTAKGSLYKAKKDTGERTKNSVEAGRRRGHSELSLCCGGFEK